MKQQPKFWFSVAFMAMMGMNLVSMPFMLVPLLWGGVFAVFCLWTQHLAERYKLWVGFVWLILTGVLIVSMLSHQAVGVEMRIAASTGAFCMFLWFTVQEYRSGQQRIK